MDAGSGAARRPRVMHVCSRKTPCERPSTTMSLRYSPCTGATVYTWPDGYSGMATSSVKAAAGGWTAQYPSPPRAAPDPRDRQYPPPASAPPEPGGAIWNQSNLSSEERMRYHRTKGAWQRQNRHGYTDGASARREPCRCQPTPGPSTRWCARGCAPPDRRRAAGEGESVRRRMGIRGCLTGEEDNG